MATKLEKLPVDAVRFVGPIDFPGQQLDGCNRDKKNFIIFYIPAIESFEITSLQNEAVNWMEYVPRERVQKFKLSEEVSK